LTVMALHILVTLCCMFLDFLSPVKVIRMALCPAESKCGQPRGVLCFSLS
jgi:hypothetical protein